MAIHKFPRGKLQPRPRSSLLLIIVCVLACTALLYLASFFFSTTIFSFPASSRISVVVGGNDSKDNHRHKQPDKYLYWGDRIDCPGKHCESCAGLGHQESSLRCALEEAMFLGRTFVMPSRMCINPIHNNKGILHQSNSTSSEERWTTNSCAMDSLYDISLISEKVPVILDNSKQWHRVLSTSMKLGSRGIANVQAVSRNDLQSKSSYSNILLVNRTASPLAWFMECKDRNDRSAVLLPHSFLPSMAAKKLQNAAEKIKALLGDYDAIHVRRGDILKTRKDRFGVDRTLHPHIDRDTRPEFIQCRIAKWCPPGRTLFIASNERKPGFFSPLASRPRKDFFWIIAFLPLQLDSKRAGRTIASRLSSGNEPKPFYRYALFWMGGIMLIIYK
ncbi:OLC1v1036421C4 [Oldenlandia corymbosa var. corymbosa]|uniref:OLC1v1036421C4 n=1 Tax=Oldenlandia corymbosa var. corymbosa TaxID=529605 RepID=A0AAV1CV87_OLDCO|nr:OLC1v1036421C4 [Oldenlandia corymbosa var. corymbosa]